MRSCRALFLESLDRVHSAGVVHGDIRTWNLLFDGDGCPMIIDFDRATREASAADFSRERRRMEFLLDGKIDDDES